MGIQTDLSAGVKSLVFLLELELGYRIDGNTWTQDSSPNTNCYSTDHSPKYIGPEKTVLFEGPPSRVRECSVNTHVITDYGAGQSSLANCQSITGSWFYDPSTGLLHVHTTGGDSPASGNYIIESHFWTYFCNAQYPAPNTIAFNGNYYQPRLSDNALPQASLSISPFSQGGVQQTWDEIILENGDGAYDAALSKYIWHSCQFFLKVGLVGYNYSQFVSTYRGRTAQIQWNDTQITINADDEAVTEY